MNNNIIDINSLTPSQEGMYAQYFQNTDTKTYQLQNLSMISKNVDLKLLEKSVELLAVRHQVLKSAFTVLKSTGAIKQIILENRKPDFTILSQDEPFSQEVLDKIIEENTKSYLDLQKDSLFRVVIIDFKDCRFMLMHAHHIILDGWCLPVLADDIQKYYDELYIGKSIDVLIEEIKKQITSETSYAHYANWIRKQNTAQVSEYWQNIFNNYSPAHIFNKESSDNFNSKDIVSFTTPLTYNLSENIEQFAKRNKVSPNSVFECAFGIALQKFSGSEDIIFGKVISGRSIPLKNIERTIGPFINTVLARTQTNESTTLGETLNETQIQTINANTNGILPLSELYKRTGIDTKSVDSLFVFENYFIGDKKELSAGPLGLQFVSFDEQTEFNLTVTILKENNSYAIRLSYAADFYTKREIESFLNGYVSILTSALDENIFVKDIAVNDDISEIARFNDTPHEYDVPGGSTLYSLFEVAAKENKDNICITANGESVTFGEFLKLSERVDSEIRKVTGGKKSIIGVICDRSIEMYASIYGIIRGGNAYLPIDPTYPQDRIDYILENSSAPLVLTQGIYTEKAGSVPFVNMTDLIASKEKFDVLPCCANEDDTAYVIYTSGSTGNPKGAKVSHKSAVNRILWMEEMYPLEENGVILQKTPYTFDVSVWEHFWWGIKGKRLAASKPGEHFLPAKIVDEIESNKVTHLHFVPSVFDLFVAFLENNRTALDKIQSVKHIFLSGEALPASLVQRFYALCSFEKVKLHNLYGPTECAVDVTYYDCSPTDIDPVPIGKPIFNTQIYVVDKYLKQCPIGVKGEILIGGVNVGQGYLNNPTLTAEKFIKNPFGDGIVYKTGDLGYWREDGEVVFCGRIDTQIKLHGQRIEIGEIESVLSAIEGIDGAAVCVRNLNGQDILVAFYCGNEFDIASLKTICETSLPKYMVPSSFNRIDTLPLNSSGKLDRKKLVQFEISGILKEEIEAPENETESLICEQFKIILGVDEIGRNSDFFDLGGTSLNMISLLSNEFFENIAAADFIANPTPKKLALILNDNPNKKTYIKTLLSVEGSKKAIICFPYAGGGAEAYAVFKKTLAEKTNDYSLFFIDFLRNHTECKNAAKEIIDLSKEYELYFYSHCAGATVAMDILNILESNGNNIIKNYISAGFIPPAELLKENFWNTVDDNFLLGALKKAGADFSGLAQQQITDMLTNFRKDTDFTTEYFGKDNEKIATPISVIISKTDIFTENFDETEIRWNERGDNIKSINYIDTDSHYFQKDNCKELIQIIFNII